MSTASVAGWQPTTTRGNVARQIKAQRRGYARAVLRTLAHTQQHRPGAQVQRLLRDTLTPLGCGYQPLPPLAAQALGAELVGRVRGHGLRRAGAPACRALPRAAGFQGCGVLVVLPG